MRENGRVLAKIMRVLKETSEPGITTLKLEELARELRTKYDQYDNINIEVFDDEESARAFADRNARDSQHNVLSISRHKESGRDVITIYGVPLLNSTPISSDPINDSNSISPNNTFSLPDNSTSPLD